MKWISDATKQEAMKFINTWCGEFRPCELSIVSCCGHLKSLGVVYLVLEETWAGNLKKKVSGVSSKGIIDRHQIKTIDLLVFKGKFRSLRIYLYQNANLQLLRTIRWWRSLPVIVRVRYVHCIYLLLITYYLLLNSDWFDSETGWYSIFESGFNG